LIAGESKGTNDHHPETESNGALSERMSAGESKGTKTTVFYVYVLLCSDGSLYVGSTEDLQLRLRIHNAGRGAAFAAQRRPVTLAYSEQHRSRAAARRREAQLKGWTKAKKEALVAGDRSALHELARRRG
jgi:predicted GIY-YIG superfamily endonuclease